MRRVSSPVSSPASRNTAWEGVSRDSQVPAGTCSPRLSYGVCVMVVNEDEQAIVAHDVGDYLLGAGKFNGGHSHMLPEAPKQQ